MHIKSMVIDGFKSYGKRTEVNNFDPAFNAITGLNGSGKSNILDAICFVLGITNLKNVRAANLQDLVYKAGQANITKASVSVFFDNSNKELSPAGYEQQKEIVVTRQVVIGAKSKYLINGVTVQNNRVHDLFRSVQLNVNNPHFLIMQGRITKVLNMKSMEILAMIEEAAGTHLYKTKKECSLRTLERKDIKMADINRQLQEDLQPKIAKLREERMQYAELQKVLRELEQLTRVHTAYKFVTAEDTSTSKAKEVKDLDENIKICEKKLEDGDVEMKTLEKTAEEIQARKDQEGNSQLKAAEKVLSEAEKVEAVLLAKEKDAQEHLKAETRRRQQLIKNIETDEGLLLKKKEGLEKEQGEYSVMEERNTDLTKKLEDARRRHQAASMGRTVDEEGNAITLQEQLINTEKNLTEARTEIKQLQMKMNPLKAELGTKKDQAKQAGGNFIKEQTEIKALEKAIASLQKEAESLQPAVVKRQELSQRRDILSNELRGMESQLNSKLRSYPRAMFEYSDPEPNFDRRQVFGLVCRLFTLKDKAMATALETAAGAKLYNVVTTTDTVAKKLVSGKCVSQRITYLPLNKVGSRCLPPSVVKNAKLIAGEDNVHAALDLVEFPENLKTAMEFVFGSTLVCRDLRTAKTVAFDPKVMTRCVTMEGDVVDPAGTMSGGAPSRGGSVLAVLSELGDLEQKVTDGRAELMQITQQLRQLEPQAERHAGKVSELDFKKHQEGLLRNRMQQSTHGRLEMEIASLEKDIATTSTRLVELQEVEQKLTKLHKELEMKVKQGKALHDKEVKEAEKLMKQLQADLDKGREKWEQCEQKFKIMELEISDLMEAIKTAKEEIEFITNALKEREEGNDGSKEELEEASNKVKELRAAVQQQKKIIAQQNREITAANARRELLMKEKGKLELELKRLGFLKKNTETEAENAAEHVKQLLKKHDWIQQERRLFGQPGVYDFKTVAPEEVNERISNLNGRKKSLEKRTNAQAVHILSKAEEQLKDLLKKKNLVDQDRRKLQEVISKLDKKMVDVLHDAWKKINMDFGSIFSTLLKGADAKLVSANGDDNVLNGLEVKVGFGGKWKDSLGELSGGQRSLVALSLILAMLLFKPAPIYILDEVDAALDPSHTENIGAIIQSKFKQSQFIIVSLKEGMFSNANVLFRTKFVDGMSTVERHVQKKITHNSK